MDDYNDVDRKEIPGLEKEKGNKEYANKNYSLALKHYSFVIPNIIPPHFNL